MNYLAHLYLSGDDNEDLLIGNFITDGLKGADKSQYNQGVLDGITLHRKIDDFTDKHDVFVRSTKRLKEKYGLYAWVIVDVFYDHFLAKNWDQYHPESLDEYAKNIYTILDRRHNELPPNSQRFLWYMKEYHILYNYSKLEGMAKVLDGLNRRTKMKSGMDKAIEDLTVDFNLYETDFNDFFPDLEAYVKSQIS
jgi:acyl carrier protein phosphodiesterase